MPKEPVAKIVEVKIRGQIYHAVYSTGERAAREKGRMHGKFLTRETAVNKANWMEMLADTGFKHE